MSASNLNLQQLTPSVISTRLRERAGLSLAMGPFAVRIRSQVDSLVVPMRAVYGDFPVLDANPQADFNVDLQKPFSLRAWIQPQVLFKLDGRNLFEPFPEDTAFPFFEWGLNWCVGQRCHQYLITHSAVLERNGQALLLPAIPGSGKSTLCAALVFRGWRLLSDEFGLFDLAGRRLVPFPRPVALKNESIDVIRRFAPDAVLGPLFPKTRKGTVAHLRPPTAAVQRMDEAVKPAWIIFPKFTKGAAFSIHALPKAQAFLRLAHNSFNYEITGADGFRAVAEIIRACDCYDLNYGDLDDVIARIDRLTA
ncbi:HprK-related kinase A [Methylomagnum sp.]